MDETKKTRKELEEAENERKAKEFVAQHGSALLKARLAEGFDWEALFRQEFADAVLADLPFERVPAGEDQKIDIRSRTTPTLPEIQARRKIQKFLGKNGTAGLVWVEYTFPDDAGYSRDDEGYSRCEIEIEINTPLGIVRRRYFPSEKKS